MDGSNIDDFIPRIALGVAAHPDDLDFGMSGTVAKWAASGCDVYYLILTNGNKGSSDPDAVPSELTELRREEQRTAAKILGVKEVFFCDYEDGLLEVSSDVKCDIIRAIRRLQPEVVLTMDPTVVYAADRGIINHPDHRAAGQATLDAVFPLARDHLSYPEIATVEGLAPHKVKTVLLFNLIQRNYYVDITSYLDKKIAALAAHASQMPDMDKVAAKVTDIASTAGRLAGVTYAEAYIRIDIGD